MGLTKYGDKQQGRVIPDPKKKAAKEAFTEKDRQELAEEQADALGGEEE